MVRGGFEGDGEVESFLILGAVARGVAKGESRCYLMPRREEAPNHDWIFAVGCIYLRIDRSMQ